MTGNMIQFLNIRNMISNGFPIFSLKYGKYHGFIYYIKNVDKLQINGLKTVASK